MNVKPIRRRIPRQPKEAKPVFTHVRETILVERLGNLCRELNQLEAGQPLSEEVCYPTPEGKLFVRIGDWLKKFSKAHAEDTSQNDCVVEIVSYFCSFRLFIFLSGILAKRPMAA